MRLGHGHLPADLVCREDSKRARPCVISLGRLSVAGCWRMDRLHVSIRRISAVSKPGQFR